MVGQHAARRLRLRLRLRGWPLGRLLLRLLLLLRRRPRLLVRTRGPLGGRWRLLQR